VGENHTMLFLTCLQELHSLEAPTSFFFHMQLEGGFNPLVSEATTWGKFQLPNYLATTTCPCPVQLPWSRSRMMEPLPHNHCEIYHCKTIPTYSTTDLQPTYRTALQSICTWNEHLSTKYNRYRTCSSATCICMCPIYTTTCVCTRLVCYATCVYPMKTSIQ